MPFSLHRVNRRSLLAVGLSLVITLTTLAFGLRTLNRTSAAVTPFALSVAPTMAAPAPLAIAQTKATPAPLIVEEITLRPTGFYPAKLSRPKGAFLLVVCNRTGKAEVNVELAREVGNGAKEKVKEAKIPRKVLDWNDTLDLNPGTYLLTEASNPKWVCELIITSK